MDLHTDLTQTDVWISVSEQVNWLEGKIFSYRKKIKEFVYFVKMDNSNGLMNKKLFSFNQIFKMWGENVMNYSQTSCLQQAFVYFMHDYTVCPCTWQALSSKNRAEMFESSYSVQYALIWMCVCAFAKMHVSCICCEFYINKYLMTFKAFRNERLLPLKNQSVLQSSCEVFLFGGNEV